MNKNVSQALLIDEFRQQSCQVLLIENEHTREVLGMVPRNGCILSGTGLLLGAATALFATRLTAGALPGIGNVLGRIGSGRHIIAMDGHIDTVGISDRAA
jgi:hypothetical protein